MPAAAESKDVYLRIDRYLQDGDILNAMALFESLEEDFERGVRASHQAAIDREIPAFLSSFMAKSGGTYLHNHLIAAGALDLVHQVNSQVDTERAYLIPSRLKLFLKGGASGHSHMRAGPWNTQVMHDCGVKRFWVHARDPRQAALSSYWHGQGQGQGSDETVVRQRLVAEEQNKEARARLTGGAEDLFDMPMDVQVREQFTWRNSWIEEWVAYLPILRFDVLLTTHEEMVADAGAFEERVLRFFDAPSHMRGVFGDILPHDRFRKGSTDEWRHTVLPETQDWMTAQISPEIAKTLGWRL